MHKNTRPHIPPPSIAPSAEASTVVPSEIDNGETRMRMIKPLCASNYVNNNAKRSVKPHMPAGFEREMNNFDKYNQ